MSQLRCVNLALRDRRVCYNYARFNFEIAPFVSILVLLCHASFFADACATVPKEAIGLELVMRGKSAASTYIFTLQSTK